MVDVSDIFYFFRRRPRSLPTFSGFERQKQNILALLRQEREKGRNKKDDQNWPCFFCRKVHRHSFKQIFA